MSNYPELDALHFFQAKFANDQLQLVKYWNGRNGVMVLLRDGSDTYLAILFVNGLSWHVKEGGFFLVGEIATYLTMWAGIPESE